ncbi:hybrid sensor histidine kinase/response regulator transcription factor [Aliiglaciecola litoralis]|uniref:hybrid sensor histidine kinase/response regulator transcription factor n=1 Tax=Aliiglaciecola litoralis TaxID=582857 RepID=UPI0031DC78B8
MQVNIYLSLVICLTISTYADSFESSYEIDGQSTGLIYTVFQGKNAIWIGGENGLFRLTGTYSEFYSTTFWPFDGYDIEGVVEDEKGRLWLSFFGNGIVVFNPTEQKYTHLTLSSGLNSNTCLEIRILNGNIAVNCVNTLSIIDVNTLKVTNFNEAPASKILDISSLQTRNNKAYFANSLNKIYVLENSKLKNIELGEEIEIVSSFFVDGDETIWVSTGEGLHQVKGETVQRVLELDYKQEITYLNAFNKDNLIYFSNGFNLFNTTTSKVTKINSISSASQIALEEVYDLTRTVNENILFSAPLIGIGYFNNLFLSLDKLPYIEKRGKNIQASLGWDDTSIIIAHNNNIYIYQIALNKFTLLLADVGVITAIARDKSGEHLYLGVENMGVLLFEVTRNSNFQLDFLNIFPIKQGLISDIKTSSSGLVYFSVIEAAEKGLYIYDSGKVIPIDEFKGIDIDTILINKQKEVLLSTRNSGILSYKANKTIKNSIKKGFINNCLIEDSAGTIWLCTDGAGLAYVDESNNELVFVDPKFTGGSRHIRELVEDSEGYLWVMTNQGLIRYDHSNASSIKLGKEDGINDVDFEITASINLSNDRILVAGDSQNYIINTKLANHYLDQRLGMTTNTVFVDLTVRNREVSGVQSRKPALYSSISTSDNLEFSNDDFLMTLTFAANNFIDREILGFEYRLVGLDSSWVAANAKESSATYSTLPSGDYEFQVRVVDPKSTASQPISSLNFTMLPPFWQTWQAYVIYIIVLTLTIVTFFKLRTIKLARENSRLESSVLERTIKLASSENKIGKLLQHKELLFANASHEIRTPLALISGPLEKLSNMAIGEQAIKYIEMAKQNSMRLSKLADEILDLSKVDSKKINEKTKYNLHASINVVLESFKPLTLLKQQTLLIENNAEGVGSYLTDSLEKIMSNLLINASKYSPSNTEVIVKATTRNDELEIVIADCGAGIKEQDLEKMFERYTRLDNASDTDGTGLGLAVVKELVIANNGLIEVESKLNGGTRFIVRLPVCDPSEIDDLGDVISEPKVFADELCVQNSITPLPILEDGNLQLPTILIVEDNIDMRTYVSNLLSEQYQCETAKDGQEGFEKSLALLPDLIVSDLMMPKLNGFEFTKAIREHELTCHIPIIMLTAKGDDETRIEGWTYQVDELMTKPFTNEELIARIANLLAIRRNISNRFTHSSNKEDSNPFLLCDSEYYSERDRRFFDKFLNWIDNSYTNDKVTRKQAADALAVSERQLNRKLDALVGSSFNELLKKYRLSEAKKLLIEGRQISLVAYESGFSSPSYFSTCFKEEFGMSPKAFVESL